MNPLVQRNFIQGGDVFMPGIKIRDNESFEGALRRFKKQCEKAGTLTELKKREFFEKPSLAKKKKREASAKRIIIKDRY